MDTRFKYEVLINLNESEYLEGQIIKVTGSGLPIVASGGLPKVTACGLPKVTSDGLPKEVPKEVTLSNIYQSPRMLRDQIRQFINEPTVLITNIENKNKVILAGDYNLNLLKIN